jgi:hypothetical protein
MRSLTYIKVVVQETWGPNHRHSSMNSTFRLKIVKWTQADFLFFLFFPNSGEYFLVLKLMRFDEKVCHISIEASWMECHIQEVLGGPWRTNLVQVNNQV